MNLNKMKKLTGIKESEKLTVNSEKLLIIHYSFFTFHFLIPGYFL